MQLAELFVTIVGRDAGLNRTLVDVHRNLLGVAAGAERALVAGVGRAFSLAATTAGLAGAAMGVAMYKAVEGASDLAETVAKVEQVFGPAAGTVKGTADELAKAFGLPKREILDAAAGIGLVGKGAGQTQQQAANLGSQMAKLAADASSFYNVPLGVALEKIRAGLVGESEPLRAFGVMLSEDAVKAEALRMGLAKTAKGLTDSNKVAARASLIAKGLKDATGDLERTQDGAANQSRKLWGQLENLGDTIGAKLLPVFGQFLNLANTVLTDVAADVGKLDGVFAAFAASAASAMDTAGMVYRNFGDVVSLVSLDVSEYVERTVTFVGQLGEAFKAVFDYLVAAAPSIGSAILTTFMTPLDTVKNMVLGLIGVFEKLMNGELPGLEDWMKTAPEAMQHVFDEMPELKLPAFEFDASGFDAARQQITDRIAEREGARPNAKPNAAAGGKAGAPAGGAGEAAKPGKFFAGGLEEFQKKLQEGAFAKDDAAKKTAANTGKIAVLAEQQLAFQKGVKPEAGFAKGPA